MTLQVTWFILLFVLLIGYAILDGFDLGVGMLHLLGRDDRERRISLNSIGPVWDGNEVWLLTGGGALFAAFPPVYATVFSACYLALMLLLVALIGRAVSLEFRSKVESPAWRSVWDIVFAVGSLLPALLLGVAFGNILRGLPIDAAGNFQGSFLGLLNPYSLLVGVLTVVTFLLHGALYLSGKSDGAMRQRLIDMLPKLWIGYFVLYLAATVLTIIVSPFLFAGFATSPLALALTALVLAAALGTRYFIGAAKYGSAFIASSAAIGAMIALAAVGLFPRLVPSTIDLANSLTITNSSSSQRTLLAMLIIVLLGVPLVLGYTAFVYRIFKGKVVLTEESY